MFLLLLSVGGADCLPERQAVVCDWPISAPASLGEGPFPFGRSGESLPALERSSALLSALRCNFLCIQELAPTSLARRSSLGPVVVSNLRSGPGVPGGQRESFGGASRAKLRGGVGPSLRVFVPLSPPKENLIKSRRYLLREEGRDVISQRVGEFCCRVVEWRSP